MGYLDFKYTHESLSAAPYGNDVYYVAPRGDFYRLGISLSRKCNLACRHCYYHSNKNSYRTVDMPVSQLQTILHGLPRLASVNFGMEGEPFAYAHIFEALALAAEKTEAIMLVTNGTLLTAESIKELSRYPMANIVLSTEGATQKIYEMCRTGSSFLCFCENAARLANEFGDIVSLHATIFKGNLQDLLELPNLAANLGIKNISFQQLRINRHIIERGIISADELELLDFLRRIIEIADSNNIILNFDSFFGSSDIMSFLMRNSTARIKINTVRNNAQVCPVIFQCTSILADGTIFPCCGDFRPATVKEYSFDGIFNHSYLLKLRFLTQTGRIPYPCKVCHHETSANEVVMG